MIVFKKRPSSLPRLKPAPTGPLRSKMEPPYWRNRLFRNTFTSNGSRFKVNHWSVKIQHLGTRKTFSLHSGNQLRAAAEACDLFRTIVQQGWEAALSRYNGRKLPPDRHNLPDLENW